MNNDIPQIGGRIRQLRRQKALTQASLARELGISSSYLNLLEHNRRKLTIPLLLKITQKFGLEIGDIQASDEQRLSGDLLELFSDGLFGDLDITNHDIKEFANSSPVVARAIVVLFDKYCSIKRHEEVEPDTRLASEQVSDFLQEQNNHFECLEDVANRVKCDLGHANLGTAKLCGYLMNVFGISIEISNNAQIPEFNKEKNQLCIPEILPTSSRLFALAKCIGEFSAEVETNRLVENAGFSHTTVETLARSALASYVAGAIMMPYQSFLGAAEQTRYDIEHLCARYNTSFEQVCHRLTTLQRPGESGVPFHLVRTDIAGNISKRFSNSGIHIPRHGGACPRWNIYEAFMQPGRITIQMSQMPDESRYFCIARTLTKGENSYKGDIKHMSIGLGCDFSQAHRLVYSDGYNLDNLGHLRPIGVSCRVCPRNNCTSRAFPALI